MPNPTVYPRPEYPRPDFQRGTLEGIDWVNLNGPWQFRFDGNDTGEKESWFKPDEAPWREQITVPFCWESLAAWGEGDAAGNQNYYATRVFRNPLEVTRENHRHAPRYEIGWYRRKIKVPKNEHWEGKRVILTIGAADFFTDVWCNGEHVGYHEGGYLPCEFDLTDSLEIDDEGQRCGEVIIRVEDPMDNHEQPVGKQWRWYTTVSGIWQTVYLEPRHQSHVECCRITPDLDSSSARFEIEVKDAPAGAMLRIEIQPPTGKLISHELPINGGMASRTIDISPVAVWNPNEPFLYWTKLRVLSGKRELDLVRTYFGMRKVTSAAVGDPKEPEALCLNGVPRYLRGALYQSYYPEGVYTAGDAATLRNDIAYAKKVGFNFLRVHIKLDDPLLLYYADTMGMLLMCDFPNFGEGGDTPAGRRRYEEMMRGAIRRDFNHPSIFAWCCFNETWGFGGQVEFVKLISKNPKDQGAVSAAGISAVVPAEQARDEAEAATAKVKYSNASSHAFVQEMWQLAKKLDSTRLIEDMSVVHWDHLDYYAHGDTDINSWHFYMADYWKAKEHIEKVVRATYAGSNFNYVQGFAQKSQPLMNSEYGGVGALDGDRDTSWTFKFLTNELRRHQAISGYIYTELTDVEWEYNGFLNYDRTPKQFGFHPAIINESDVLPINYPPVERLNTGQMVRVEVSSSHYSTHPQKGVFLQWRLAGIDTLGKVHHDLAVGAVPIPFPHRKVAHAHTIELQLPGDTMMCTLSVEAIKQDGGRRLASNFTNLFATTGYPPTREDRDRITVLRAYPADWARGEWSGYAGDRDQERFEDACWGFGHGYFEWDMPIAGIDLAKVYRMRVICEASSRRMDTPQTDGDHFPTTLEILTNGIRVFTANLPNHPHDSRGALSYLRGGKGAYGYLCTTTIEGALLRQMLERNDGRYLYLRCEVPSAAIAQNGLQIYGAENGRYPICPTVILEW